ncbi:hypothetical protein KFU94_10045 [Chloroflexi bacterium TSY]|nr:hypothetical protein [Chloroflexi bacterium TSY]
MNTFWLAYIFVFFTAIVVLFQFALAAGMPWGHLAMGGRYPGRFPPKMRIAAAARGLIWVAVAFSAISTILNIITPSKWERILWVPVTVVMLISSVIVALN